MSQSFLRPAGPHAFVAPVAFDCARTFAGRRATRVAFEEAFGGSFQFVPMSSGPASFDEFVEFLESAGSFDRFVPAFEARFGIPFSTFVAQAFTLPPATSMSFEQKLQAFQERVNAEAKQVFGFVPSSFGFGFGSFAFPGGAPR
jgi:hypothetical protein